MNDDETHVEVVDVENLPPELVSQLAGHSVGSEYTFHELALAYLAHHGRANLNDLQIYIYRIRNKVISRAYLYQIVYRLRKRGQLEKVHMPHPVGVVYRLTKLGEELAPAYVEQPKNRSKK
jgi:DNA-binding HxlR family transcriptional regulator